MTRTAVCRLALAVGEVDANRAAARAAIVRAAQRHPRRSAYRSLPLRHRAEDAPKGA
ncbi:hypothetical protein [Actinoallomurus bryophytorum]|uniref:hypothetical protein n=1 Tax=Actinoallomurus bryophytorum TaxID=1490222 RepID=UPI001639FF20|nr:hypothetical protein [Actinoallomurus bryophytorum]